MVHNLEKNVKGCFKRRVSITLAMLTIFAITGSVGFAEILKENYEKKDFGPLPTVSGPTRGNVATAFNKTNTQVNSNTVTIDVHSEELLKLNELIKTERLERKAEDETLRDKIKEERLERKAVDKTLQANIDAEVERSKTEDKRLENSLETEISRSITEDLKHNKQIAENTERLVEERKARREADKALQAALDAEIERSEAKDKEHDEGIAANKKAIEDEVARSKAKDDEHDKGIADNKEAIETEVERSKAKDKEHDEGIVANKKAIEDEVARSTTEDLKHDKGIADNKKAIEELRRDSEEGIASVAAMSVLDFKGAPVGRVGIGAAIGGYRGKQAVAVGMAFAPSENLNFTGKVGLSTDDIRNSAYGVGVNYFF
ncbi:hypothetical protein A2U14_08035 [Fusobacterium necrophorum subsp. funduliforme]|uniref:YadA-like family protein n=1 Tax=Fusobacterium necrophorum TaxID=859 RepID=UPI000787A0D6|nr:YadA-like family protein [Fusobacterium necrophorum]KYM63260.1 hypothetical protein A2U14_08035 [Fusobacterium necrophorum subsp. funduliforme]